MTINYAGATGPAPMWAIKLVYVLNGSGNGETMPLSYGRGTKTNFGSLTRGHIARVCECNAAQRSAQMPTVLSLAACSYV